MEKIKIVKELDMKTRAKLRQVNCYNCNLWYWAKLVRCPQCQTYNLDKPRKEDFVNHGTDNNNHRTS